MPDAESASVKMFYQRCREFVVGSDYAMKAEINDSIPKRKDG
jgi:hypothetical protein